MSKSEQKTRAGLRIEPPVYVLRLQGKPGDNVRALRAILKSLLRQYGFRCLDAHEE